MRQKGRVESRHLVSLLYLDQNGTFPSEVRTMPELRHRRDLLPADHHDVAAAVEASKGLSGDERERLLQEVFRAVYTYRDTDDVSVLENLARDLQGTVRLHSSAGYRKVYEQHPGKPTPPGRSVSDIFADAPRG
jgi:hypothetical protein